VDQASKMAIPPAPWLPAGSSEPWWITVIP
jgi:hypothetical protein